MPPPLSAFFELRAYFLADMTRKNPTFIIFQFYAPWKKKKCKIEFLKYFFEIFKKISKRKRDTRKFENLQFISFFKNRYIYEPV